MRLISSVFRGALLALFAVLPAMAQDRGGAPSPGVLPPATAASLVRTEAPPVPVVASAMPALPVLNPNTPIAVFQDRYPWNSPVLTNYLTAHGIAFQIHGSAAFAALDFSQFPMIIISSTQPTAFYNAAQTFNWKFTDYVANGGTLLYSACEWGGEMPYPYYLPGGMQVSWNGSNWNVVNDPTHYAVQGVPSPFYGNWANHTSFTLLPPGARVITSVQGGNPTLVEYSIGAGRILASGLTMEYGMFAGQSAGQITQLAVMKLFTETNFDLHFSDDLGKSKVCVNSVTGNYKYMVLEDVPWQGTYIGQGIVSTANGILTVETLRVRTKPSRYFRLTYDAANHMALTWFIGAVPGYADFTSLCYDTNTADSPQDCSFSIFN